MIDAILVFIYLYFFISFVKSIIRGLKIQKTLEKQLKKEEKVKNFEDTLNYFKELNPWGGLTSSTKMKENLLKGNNSKEIESIVNEMYEIHIVARKRGLILLFVFLLLTLNMIFF